MGKGSKRRPVGDQKAFDENWDKIFGPKKENPDLDPEYNCVRYKQHPETGELIPDYMWAQFDMLPPKKSNLQIIRDSHYEYVSPATGKYISGKRAQRYDLQSSGCRIYEGRESEQRAADAHRKDQDKRFEQTLEKSMRQSLSDIRWQRVPTTEKSKDGRPKISWEW